MGQIESSASNPRPNTREDGDLKEEENRRMAKYASAVAEASCDSAEARREWAELERLTSETAARAELNKYILEERLCIIEELRRDAIELYGAAQDLCAST